jgi:hypothetical protein
MQTWEWNLDHNFSFCDGPAPPKLGSISVCSEQLLLLYWRLLIFEGVPDGKWSFGLVVEWSGVFNVDFQIFALVFSFVRGK